MFGRNISCYRCFAPKPGTNARHGDWICLNRACGAHNYASRHTCYRCHVPKGAEKPGDWPCPNCLSNNFASRTECFRCHLPRPPGYATVFSNIRPGDWLCPNPTCGSNVFANRETCYRCNTARPHDAEVISSPNDARVGDWLCPGCNAVCYANRQTCFRCQTLRPTAGSADTHTSMMSSTASDHSQSSQHAPSTPTTMPASIGYPNPAHIQFAYYNPYAMGYYAPYYHPQHSHQQRMHGVYVPSQYKQREGDWICAKCKETNFARRTACFKCHEPRIDYDSQQTSPQPPPHKGNGISPDSPESKTAVSAQ